MVSGLSRMPFQSFCIWRRPMPIPESFACAVTGADKRKAVRTIPQAFVIFDGVALEGAALDELNMDASRKL